jgi:hypothetical protein
MLSLQTVCKGRNSMGTQWDRKQPGYGNCIPSVISHFTDWVQLARTQTLVRSLARIKSRTFHMNHIPTSSPAPWSWRAAIYQIGDLLKCRIKSTTLFHCYNLLCGLVVRAPGCRYRDPGFDSRRYKIFWVAVGLERGPLSLVKINEELLEMKNSGSGLEN